MNQGLFNQKLTHLRYQSPELDNIGTKEIPMSSSIKSSSSQSLSTKSITLVVLLCTSIILLSLAFISTIYTIRLYNQKNFAATTNKLYAKNEQSGALSKPNTIMINNEETSSVGEMSSVGGISNVSSYSYSSFNFIQDDLKELDDDNLQADFDKIFDCY